jgi:hypothetical protein
MNPFRGMDATPPNDPDPALAAQASRARRVLMLAMALMIGVPLLLFVLLHT